MSSNVNKRRIYTGESRTTKWRRSRRKNFDIPSIVRIVPEDNTEANIDSKPMIISEGDCAAEGWGVTSGDGSTLKETVGTTPVQDMFGTPIVTTEIPQDGLSSARFSEETSVEGDTSFLEFGEDEEFFIEPEVDHVSEEELEEEYFDVLDDDFDGIDTTLFTSQDEEPIYEGSSVSIRESALMLIIFFMHFKISYSCMTKVIELIICHLPRKNKVLKSIYLVRKYIARDSPIFVKHTYCEKCKNKIPDGKKCSDKNCTEAKLLNFLTFPIDSQVRNLFQRLDFRTMLQHRFKRQKKNPENLEDVYDGSIYKKYSAFFSEAFNFSMSYYADGVELFKSAKSTVWPFFFPVNEIPYNKRYLPENIIFGGLWYGGTKPDFNLFLRPMYESLVKLRNGISIKINDIGQVINVKCMVLNGVGDLPARSAMLNMSHFNGYFGCPKCLIEGKPVKINNAKRSLLVYPYSDIINLRVSADMIKCAEVAIRQAKAERGIKGFSILSKMVPDFIRSMGIDMMHALCSGAGGKKFLELWCSRALKKSTFSLNHRLSDIDKRLTSLKPPNFIKRAPRAIETHLKLYKASEFKNWFFYYSVPVLYGIMPIDQLNNYFLLVHAFYILSMNSISKSDVEKARKLINKFVEQFQVIYGKRYMSANMHSMLHMCDNVLELGPLFVTSCFPLEDLNGKMKSLINGSRYAEIKISESFYTYQNLPRYVSQLKEDTDAKAFIKNIKSTNLRVLERISPSAFSLGKYSNLSIVSYIIAEAFQSIDKELEVGQCWMFHRLHKDKVLYSAKSYTRATKSISYCIEYKGGNIGLIESFIKLKTCGCATAICTCNAEFYAIVNHCLWIDIDGLEKNDFIKEIIHTDTYIAVNYNDLEGLCVLSEVSERFFCAKRVNTLEIE